MKHTSVISSLANAFQIPLVRSATARLTQSSAHITSNYGVHCLANQQASTFSTTANLQKKRRGPRVKADRRVTMIRYALYHPLKYLPRPLRFSRLRALRHWTIHRAWQLLQRQYRTEHERELERQWESMRLACEELRTRAGDGGRLFRQSMSRAGYFGGSSNYGEASGPLPGTHTHVEKGREGGIPIEYARGLVDTPAKDGAWDHNWKRV